jgi:hypothetical protein
MLLDVLMIRLHKHRIHDIETFTVFFRQVSRHGYPPVVRFRSSGGLEHRIRLFVTGMCVYNVVVKAASYGVASLNTHISTCISLRMRPYSSLTGLQPK